jgi:hypothetical protein
VGRSDHAASSDLTTSGGDVQECMGFAPPELSLVAAMLLDKEHAVYASDRVPDPIKAACARPSIQIVMSLVRTGVKLAPGGGLADLVPGR